MSHQYTGGSNVYELFSNWPHPRSKSCEGDFGHHIYILSYPNLGRIDISAIIIPSTILSDESNMGSDQINPFTLVMIQ